jgi:tryptophanyl-tRNA synthetase
VRDAALLRQNTYAVAAAWLACGFDTDKNLFYRQSDVPQVTELTWYLSCFTPYPMLANAHSFKDKSDRLSDVNAGLFTYPVLMAADILLYQGTHVPVGEDQKQHLELARDIAQKFNNDFRGEIEAAGYADGQFFPLPEPLIQGPATRVMSLRDGTKKMSKSDASDLSRINMSDDADTIARKFQKAKTDPEPLPRDEAGLEHRPEADNLVGIYAALADKSKADVLSEFGGGQFSTFKKALSELAVSRLAPVNAEMRRLLGDPAEIDRILAKGAGKARALAAPNISKIKDIVGFVQS